MPVSLPFSIPYRQKRKTKGIKSPFLHSSSSQTFTEVFDIHDTSKSSVSSPPGSIAESFIQPVPDSSSESGKRHSESPKVRLNFTSKDLSSQPLSDWLPKNFLHPESDLVEAQESPASNHTQDNGDRDVEQLSEGSIYDDSAQSSPADVLAHLESLDASSFVTFEGDDDFQSRVQWPSHKKHAPAPIKIPSGAFNSSRVQIVRSGQSTGRSRPHSAISTDEISAVSGTTLARALIGNSFVLSSDSRPRYRSGASVLTRQDSATLPGSDFYSAFSRGEVSPEMPLPSNAESVYSPPKMPRQDVSESPSPNARRRNSTGSIKIDGDIDPSPSIAASSTRGDHVSNLGPSQVPPGPSRVPDITEVPTPLSTLTFGQRADLDGKNFQKEPSPVSPASGGEKPVAPPSIENTPESPLKSFTSEDPPSAKSLENVIDYYSIEDTQPMQPPTLPTQQGMGSTVFRPPFSPISEESLSQLSPTTPLRSADSRYAPSPLSAKSVPGSSGYSDTSSPKSSPKPTDIVKPGRSLLPTGERGRLSQTLSLPRQRGEAAPTLSSLAGHDEDDSLVPPATSSVFNRQRSGSAPTPIKVVRDSQDISSYNITVSQDANGVPTPSSTDSDPAKQTFPETPNMFSPMWSAAATSAGLSQDGQFERALPSVPQTPLSAALPSGHAPNLAQQMLLSRAATSGRGGRGPHPSTIRSNPLPITEEHQSEDEDPAGPDPRSSIDVNGTSDRGSVSVYSEASAGTLSTTNGEQPGEQHEDDGPSHAPVVAFSEQRSPVPAYNGSHSDDLETSSGNTPHHDHLVALQNGVGSPPPYYAVVYDSPNIPTPSTDTSGADTDSRRGFSPHSPSHPTNSIGSRRRVRPPGPMGPRRPSHPSILPTTGLMTPVVAGPRQRNGSVSSIASTVARRPSLAPQITPVKFQTPPVKWRGYTIDQAKWTFTSSQLQTIVSRAIKQSADGTKIRLLPLDILDHDIPDELRQLEVRRTDIQTKYKILARDRNNMLASLSFALGESAEPQESESMLRLVSEMKDLTASMDHLAEELHSIDEQISQLQSLQDIHSASALAMALRKLNSSFLRQLEDIKILREQISTLETEKEDAWRYAESEALKYDTLTRRMELSEPSGSNRSSRMSAARKSSIRASRSGLRTSFAASRRSSVSSNNRLSISALSSGAKSTFSTDDIPPVPPIPRRPFAITTDLPTRSSIMGLSTDGFTPNSETRAMVQAQDELYEMLGFSPRHRRALSARGEPKDLLQQSVDPPEQQAQPPARPSSLPGPSELQQSTSRDVEREAMLKTLEMLSTTD